MKNVFDVNQPEWRYVSIELTQTSYLLSKLTKWKISTTLFDSSVLWFDRFDPNRLLNHIDKQKTEVSNGRPNCAILRLTRPKLVMYWPTWPIKKCFVWHKRAIFNWLVPNACACSSLTKWKLCSTLFDPRARWVWLTRPKPALWQGFAITCLYHLV